MLRYILPYADKIMLLDFFSYFVIAATPHAAASYVYA